MTMIALEDDNWRGWRVLQEMLHNAPEPLVEAGNLGNVSLLLWCFISNDVKRGPKRWPQAAVSIEDIGLVRNREVGEYEERPSLTRPSWYLAQLIKLPLEELGIAAERRS
jgi:hypothetical protein